MENKCPPYAPYIMKFILHVPKETVNLPEEHMLAHFQVKKVHATNAPSGLRGSRRAKVPFDTSEDEVIEDAPTGGVRTKHAINSRERVAVEAKRLNWFQTHVLCMQVDIHKEQYEAYKRNLNLKKQNKVIISKLSKDAQGNDGPMSSNSKIISDGKWRTNDVKWTDFDEVSSSLKNKGKGPEIPEDPQDGDDGNGSDEDYESEADGSDDGNGGGEEESDEESEFEP
jgi:hypothetical protein